MSPDLTMRYLLEYLVRSGVKCYKKIGLGDLIVLTMEHGACLEDKIFGAPSFKQQAPSLTSFKL